MIESAADAGYALFGAEALLKRSLAILEKAYGLKDRRLAPTLELYSDLLHQTGRHEEGKAMKTP